MSDRIIEWGALFLLVFTPLAFGTVQPWAEAVAVLVVSAMGLAWVAGMARDWELRVELPPGWLPAAGFLGLIALQLVPLPAIVLGLVSPYARQVVETAAQATGASGPAFHPLSLYPAETFRQGIKFAAIALLFLTLFNRYRSRERIERAVWTMVLTGSAIALFGLVQRMTWTGRFYWVGPDSPGSSPFGPFVNRAHFAGLMVVVVPIALAMLASRSDSGRRRGERLTLRDRVREWNSREAGLLWIVPVLVLVMGGAALAAGSRGGLVALVAALLAMVGLSAQYRRGTRRPAQLAVAAALIVLTAAWIGSDVLYGSLERLAEEAGRPDESPRLRIWSDAIALWRSSPVVGTGLGSFGVVFPAFRTYQAPVAFTHGESDWVQLLTDTGVLGLSLAVLTAGSLLFGLLNVLRHGRSGRGRAFALAGFVALLGSIVQGIGNYNLPIFSNFVYLAMAMAVGLRATSAVARAPEREPAARPQAQPPRAKTREVIDLPGTAAAGRLYAMLHSHRAVVSLVAYGTVTSLAYALAYLLRFELVWPARYASTFLATLPLLVALHLGCARAFKVATGRWRFVGTRDVVHLVSAASVATLLFYIATAALPFSPAVPRSVILMQWMLGVLLTAGLWLGYRMAFEQLRHRRSASTDRPTRVLIVGAGEAGNLLVREMLRAPVGYRPVGFVDDDPAKQGASLQGLSVLGTTSDLRRLARKHRVDEIIIAVPSASPAQMRRIVERCELTALPFKVLPGIAEVLDGDVRLNQLRNLRIEDLLGREPIRLELPELAADLRGKTVLITGAAGSIGSELSRQVALHHPGKLVLLDQAETDLFYLELGLREKFPAAALVPVVGDITDPATVERVFRDHRPARVFHAAAYKHVPMMETNVREAVRNNVIGTSRVADAAGRHGAEKFVLVSTDKAVRPTSVMGATKRLAEMVVLEVQETRPGTAYAAVRFGNVLGSSGSVIPIFKRQIEEGKPLTVTHPDATRYFMTIPEAVQLILQAALLPEIRGRIAMLEMGEPVRIVDLAKKILRLSGQATGNGRDIRFTGLRPGEKLHEELVAPEEETMPTPIPKVQLIASRVGTNGDLGQHLVGLTRLVGEGSDADMIEALGRLFPGIGADQAPQTAAAGSRRLLVAGSRPAPAQARQV